MFNLPVEILHLIFPLLVQRDKLECMTVCRQWHNIIVHHSLFSVIYINRQKNLENLMEKIKKDPFLGTKVEKLVLKLKLAHDFDHMVLPELFPNLRQFTTMNMDRSMELFTPKQLERKHPWCERIEKVLEIMTDRKTMQLLSSGLCKSLTYLSVGGKGEPVSDLVELLHNAPSLTKLELYHYEITLDDLELLHDSLPLLESLIILNPLFYYDTFPRYIEPAKKMKSFQYSRNEFEELEVYNPRFEYISRKYTHLEALTYEIRSFFLDDEVDVISASEFQQIMTSYLKTLGTRLKSLSLALGTGEGHFSGGFDFYMLDECGCQIKKLALKADTDFSIMERVIKTSQLLYIQSLTINEVSQERDGRIYLAWLKYFTMLKELILHFSPNYYPDKRQKMSLLRLMSHLGDIQLETLELHYLRLESDTVTAARIYPSIKQLRFYSISFGINTDVFISQAFPNLKHLELDSCFREKGSFLLPNTDLSYLGVTTQFAPENLQILLITLENNQRRLYQSGRMQSFIEFTHHDMQEDLFALPSFSSQPYGISTDIPLLTVVCNSVYDFSMTSSHF